MPDRSTVQSWGEPYQLRHNDSLVCVGERRCEGCGLVFEVGQIVRWGYAANGGHAFHADCVVK